MGYISELRKLIGHRAIIMAGAGVLITDNEGRLLLGKRTDINAWGIPGGSMEPGESLEETARRETLEETGLEVGALRLFDVFSGPQFFFTYPSGDQVYNVSVIYQTSDFPGTPRPSEEHSEWAFFARDALPEPLSPPIVPIIEKWKQAKD